MAQNSTSYVLSITPLFRNRYYRLAYGVIELFEVHTLYPLSAPLWKTVLAYIHRDDQKLGSKVRSSANSLAELLQADMAISESEMQLPASMATIREKLYDAITQRYLSGRDLEYTANQIEMVISPASKVQDGEAYHTEMDAGSPILFTINSLATLVKNSALRNERYEGTLAVNFIPANVGHTTDLIAHLSPTFKLRYPVLDSTVDNVADTIGKRWLTVFETIPDHASVFKEVIKTYDLISWVAADTASTHTEVKHLKWEDFSHLSTQDIEAPIRLSSVIDLTREEIPTVELVKELEAEMLFNNEPITTQLLVFKIIKDYQDGLVDEAFPFQLLKPVIDAVNDKRDALEKLINYEIETFTESSASINPFAEGAGIDSALANSYPNHSEVYMEESSLLDKVLKIEAEVIEVVSNAFRDQTLDGAISGEALSALNVTKMPEGYLSSSNEGRLLTILYGVDFIKNIEATISDGKWVIDVVDTVGATFFDHTNVEIIKPTQAFIGALGVKAVIDQIVKVTASSVLDEGVIEDIAKSIRFQGVSEAFEDAVDLANPVDIAQDALRSIVEYGVQNIAYDAFLQSTQLADNGTHLNAILEKTTQATNDIAVDAVAKMIELGKLNDVAAEALLELTEKAKAVDDVPPIAVINAVEQGKLLDIAAEATLHAFEKSKVDKLLETVYNLIEGGNEIQVREAIAQMTVQADNSGDGEGYVQPMEWADFSLSQDTVIHLTELCTRDSVYNASVETVTKAFHNSLLDAVTGFVEKAYRDRISDAVISSIEKAALDAIEETLINSAEIGDIGKVVRNAVYDAALLVDSNNQYDAEPLEKSIEASDPIVPVEAKVTVTSFVSKMKQRVKATLDLTTPASKNKKRVQVAVNKDDLGLLQKQRLQLSIDEGDTSTRIKKRLPVDIDLGSKAGGVPKPTEPPVPRKKTGWLIMGKPFSWSFWPWSKKR